MSKFLVGLLLCTLILGMVSFSGEAAEASESHVLLLAAPAVAAPLEPEISNIPVSGIETGSNLAAALALAHRPAAKTWSQTSGNLWSTGANWSGGTVPQAGDTVTFDATSTAACTVDNIGTFNGTITVAATYTNTITQSAAVSGVSTIAINGGVWDCAGFSLSTTNAAITVAATKQLTLGTNPTTSCGTNTLTVSGTLTYSGTWQHTGHLVESTNGAAVTGSATPTLRIDGNVSPGSGTSTWTSVDVLVNGSTNACTYTDTAAKNSGTWTITRSATATFTIAASTVCNLGTNPTSTVTTGNSFVVNGTVQWAGNWNLTGTISSGAASVFTGTSTPTLTISNSLTINATATITNAIGTVTLGTANTATYTDTGDKLSGSTIVLGNGSNKNITIAASTTARIGSNPTSANGTGTVTVNGTLTFSGNWTHQGPLTTGAAGTLTGTSSPTISTDTSITINATSTITNTITPITFRTSTLGATLTDTGDKLSGTTYVINMTTNQSLTVSASTTCRIGTNPTTVTGTGTITANGTILYSGLWNHTGQLTVGSGGTVTGSSTPSLTIDGNLNINAAASGWTSVAVTTQGGTNTGTYTDTTAKNTGIWTLTKTGGAGQTIAASTSMNLGAAPTINFGTGTLSISGTLVWSGALNYIGGSWASNNGSTISATGSPSATMQRTITFSPTTTITTPITPITVSGSVSGTILTDTGDATSGTTWIVNKSNTSFTVAAGTICRLGATPSTSVGTSTMTVTGELRYSGTWTHTGTLATSSSSTVTGSSSPSLTINQSLTLATPSTWTSVNILANGATSTTYTDTGGKNTGIWTITKTLGGFTSAASTTADLGAGPTVTMGNTNNLVATGTITGSGLLTLVGQGTGASGLSVGAAGVVSGFSGLAVRGNVTVTAGGVVPAAWPLTITSPAGDTTTINAPGITFGTSTINKTNGSVVLTAGTLPLGSNPTTFLTNSSGTPTFTINGTVTWSGSWMHSGLLTTGSTGVLTATGSPVLRITDNLTIDAASTITNPIPSIVVEEGPSTFAYSDAGDKLSGSTFSSNKTFGTTVGVQVSAAGTIMRLGNNQTWNTGSAVGITINANTELRYSGTLTVNGIIACNGTMTGTGSPSIICPLSITIDPAATWTSVNITVSNTIPATSSTYTDTAHKNTGLWTIQKQGIWVIAANSVANLGASPTVDCTLSTFVVSGTAQLSGTLTMMGSISTAATGTLSGALTDVFMNQGTWQVAVGSVFPSGLNITYYRTNSGSNNFHSIDGAVYGAFKLYGPGDGLTTFIGSSTFASWRIEGTVTRTVRVTAGTTQTITGSGATYMIAGGNSAPLTLSSTSAGMTYTLNVTGPKPINLRNVILSDLTASTATQEWWAGPGCTDGGGNSPGIVYKQNPRLRPGF